MGTQYATVVSKAGAISQDPNEIDLNVTADTGVTATPQLMSPTQGGTVTTPNFGFAGANAIIDDQAYSDDGDGSIGSVSAFAPGMGAPADGFRNEKKVAMSMGGYGPTGLAATTTLGLATAPTPNDTITIGTITYKFVASPAAPYDIDIGTAAVTGASLVAAINGTGTASATTYFAGTMPHPTVTAGDWTADEIVLTAKSPGSAGNAIVTTTALTDGSDGFTATTMGLAEGFLGMATKPTTTDDTVTIGTTVYRFMDTPSAAYDVFIGATVATSQANLVHAINGTGLAGTNWYAGTVAHPDVTAGAWTSDVLIVQAKVTVPGPEADLIATTETFTDGTDAWVAATLEGGAYGSDLAPRSSLQPIGISADVALVDQNA